MKPRPAIAVLVAISISGASLAQPPGEVTANAEGNQAYANGRFEEALAKFEDSLRLSQQNQNKQYEAIAMYSLARTYVQLCAPADADRWFKASIEARDALPDDRYARITQNLVTYARFLLSTGRPAEAIPLIDRAIPLLENVGLSQSDPIAFAELLEQEAAAQQKTGVSSEIASAHAARLRASNPGKSAKFKPDSFPQCRK